MTLSGGHSRGQPGVFVTGLRCVDEVMLGVDRLVTSDLRDLLDWDGVLKLCLCLQTSTPRVGEARGSHRGPNP